MKFKKWKRSKISFTDQTQPFTLEILCIHVYQCTAKANSCLSEYLQQILFIVNHNSNNSQNGELVLVILTQKT